MPKGTKTKKSIVNYDKMTHQCLVVKIFTWSMINMWPINSSIILVWIYDVPF